MQHLKLSKRLKKVADVTGDLEKIGDASESIGESYSNLCNYEKAKKWHDKSFKVCERVHHKEVSCFLAEYDVFYVRRIPLFHRLSSSSSYSNPSLSWGVLCLKLLWQVLELCFIFQFYSFFLEIHF